MLDLVSHAALLMECAALGMEWGGISAFQAQHAAYTAGQGGEGKQGKRDS